MSAERPSRHGFAMHYQHVWTERGGRVGLPLWFRVSSLAYGAHRRNGHANFPTGDLEHVLGRPDENGVWTPLPYKHVQRAIQSAIEYGMLGPGSTPRCLVVPQHAIEGGHAGSAAEVCTVHDKGPRTPRRATRPALRVVGE